VAQTERPGTSSRDPLLLCPCVRLLYVQLRERAGAAGNEIALIETLRDATRQSYYLAMGVSWTLRSKHLPQPPHGLALAFDVCPKEYLAEKNWNPGGSLWYDLGREAEELGLEWGGSWMQRDYPHFALSECACSAPVAGSLEA